MALSKCKECEKEVSNRARQCPHCGIDNPAAKKRRKTLRNVAWFVGAWIVLAAIVGTDEASKGAAPSALAEASAGAEVAPAAQAPDPFEPQAAPIAQTKAESAPPPEIAITYTYPSDEALDAAQRHVEKISKALEDAVDILLHGDLKAWGAHSRRFGQIVDEGTAAFGSTVFEPLGSCTAAATHARALWLEHQATQRRGGETVKGSLQFAYDQYLTHRAECLRVADPATPVATGKECLRVLSLDPETKKVVTLPRPPHCSDS
ncbi:hypothetical protein H0A70_05250 [Alcaligenaceae bacterium]|nr:hypothetical protein [Alcaligenaceae bacterium]